MCSLMLKYFLSNIPTRNAFGSYEFVLKAPEVLSGPKDNFIFLIPFLQITGCFWYKLTQLILEKLKMFFAFKITKNLIFGNKFCVYKRIFQEFEKTRQASNVTTRLTTKLLCKLTFLSFFISCFLCFFSSFVSSLCLTVIRDISTCASSDSLTSLSFTVLLSPPCEKTPRGIPALDNLIGFT